MEKGNILVTGGAGFIGSHLVDALIDEGYRVRVLDALVPQVHGVAAVPSNVNAAAEFIRADICDREAVDGALEDIDAVFHEAAEVGIGQSMYEISRYVRANDLGTAVLLEAILARQPQIKKLIVPSSNTMYGEGAYHCEDCGTVYPQLRLSEQMVSHRWEPECPACGKVLSAIGTPESKPLFPTSIYAVTKQDQEQFCLAVGRSYKIPTVALRYFNVYGSRQALSNPYTGVCAIFSARLLNGNRPIIFEDGRQTRDFVHVSDVVEANLLALRSDRADYQALNVGTGVGTSVRTICELLAKGLGVEVEPEIVGKYREADIRHCTADISKARTLLGYEPKVSLETGIPGLLDWVRSQAVEDQVASATSELESRQLVR